MLRAQLLFAGLLLTTACQTGTGAIAVDPYEDDSVLGAPHRRLAPPNSALPDLGGKADAVFPAQFDLVAEQSPVKSQGKRGLCSIFASTALIENAYIRAGVANPDFSEQYLQWLAKQTMWPDSEGSSSSINLKQVAALGTVDEAAWPYEALPWTTANDPACTGNAPAPTTCWTNGAPPASVESAPKYRIPFVAWLSTSPNTIKYHLTKRQTGVAVGFTVYRQAWNHRTSQLPINPEAFGRGIVTYPNAKDIEISDADRAGHEVVIVGWDDTLSYPRRDETGAVLLDANGQPVMETGFWLIKNSWGTERFGVNHEFKPGYGWISMRYITEFGEAYITSLPKLNEPYEVCDDYNEADGSYADEDGDGKANCADDECEANTFCADYSSVAEQCGDPMGNDEDGDGKANCADDDCAFAEPCYVPEICDDSANADEDSDGKTNCADDDCEYDPACYVAEQCDDAAGLDENNDGAANCADADCEFHPACYTPEICDDAPKADEDLDGKTNCDDDDCRGHISCPTAPRT